MICHFPTAFPKFDEPEKKRRVEFAASDVFELSFECRVETVYAYYKQCANIKTHTTLYKISVLLVSLV